MSTDLKSAEFIRVDNLDDLSKLRGSKYLQANTGNVFKQVQKDLNAGREVLFSGTPCQIDALKFFLQRDYSNLLTVDIICHGVPSQLLWEKYVEYLEQKYDAKIQSVNFRSKKYGWKKFGLEKEGENISQYLDLSKDPYMVMFLKNYCLRPSCYDCNAKRLEPMSDITIADFWGIEHIAPDLDDDKGISLVIVHTQKGQMRLNQLKETVELRNVSAKDAIKYNPSYNFSVSRLKERDSLFLDLNSRQFKKMIKKYCKKTFIQRVRNSFIHKLLSRIKHGSKNATRFSYGLLIQFKRDV